ncbi:MAG: ABC-F family ATP-binding cassette domain-containing protein [Acidimicrobiales bacterium]
MAVLVDLEAVAVRHGERALIGGLSMTVAGGDRLGVVGINGTGKSTLLKILAGVDQPDSGQVRRGRGVRIGYLEQEPSLPAGSVRASVGDSWEAARALQRLGMADAADIDVADLSGGQAKRVALARVLSQPAELLILDEPTNHLDLRAIDWLEQWLLEFRGGLVLVTHDRHLLDRVTTRMIEIDRGQTYTHDGGYSTYLEQQASREEQAAATEATRRNLARRELAWLRRGAPARTRKPQARIDAAVRIVTGRPQAAARASEIQMGGTTPRLGSKVIECKGVSYGYGTGSPKLVLSGVDLLVGPRERLGLLGANGCGKSTLLDLLAGRKAPASGTIEVGSTVVTGYYDQRATELDESARVRELVAGPGRVPGRPEDVALMDRFWFTGSLQFAPAGTLSGGERRRLQLLLVLAGRPNLLLLDEPTNDFDLETLRILEDFLDDWPGTLVVVSHDRTFLQRTAERYLSIEDGALQPVAGGLDGWIARLSDTPVVTLQGDSKAPRIRTTELPKGRSASTIGRQLRAAEQEMERLVRQRDKLNEALVAAGGEHLLLAELGRELAEVQARLTEAENRWLDLAETER